MCIWNKMLNFSRIFLVPGIPYVFYMKVKVYFKVIQLPSIRVSFLRPHRRMRHLLLSQKMDANLFSLQVNQLMNQSFKRVLLLWIPKKKLNKLLLIMSKVKMVLKEQKHGNQKLENYHKKNELLYKTLHKNIY